MKKQGELLNNAQEFMVGIPKILQKLKSEVIPLWGIMDAQNMIEHLSSALYMSIYNKTHHREIKDEVERKSKLLTMVLGQPLQVRALNPNTFVLI